MATPSRQRIYVLIAAAVAVFFSIGIPFLRWLSGVWIDWLWFGDLGQQQVFVTRIVSQLATGAVFGLATFVLLYVNLRIARSMAPKAVPIGMPEGTPEQLEVFIEVLRGGVGPILDRVVFWGCLALAFFNGLGMSSQWQTFRLALSSVPFPYNDPQFGRNVGFFVFELPAYNALSNWLAGALILTAVLTFAVHVIDGAIQPWARLKGFAPHVKAHLSVLMSFIVLAWGFRYWISIWELNYSTRGQIVGAGYTDVHAQLPAYRILIVVSIVTAFALLLNIRYKGWRLPLTALGIWVAASVLLGAVWPGLMQQFIVAPNEASAETPYIERNIEMTRKAFGLTDVKGQKFPATESLTATDVVADRQTLKNVRLWDPSIMAQSYAQLQSIRPYYEFLDVDVDRYIIDGVRQQVLVSAREMNSALLPSTAQTWVNKHLVYTHGFGLVMSPVNEADPRGMPKFIIGDVPPKTSTDLVTKQPRIYYGEATTDYVVVDTGIKEFDFPLGEKNAYYEYNGTGGVAIGSLPRRLAWALNLGSSQVLFSEYVRPESRVLIRRDLTTRLDALAPWLQYEKDAYPVLIDGRIKWVVDAYTSSGWFPYSEGIPGASQTKYLRNSVKVVVDAFDGSTTFYAFDPEDPVLQAWRKVFPSLVVDGSKIPAGIRDHFRYPQGLFMAQAEVYRTYHMTDPRVFYNKEDQWEIPGERQGKIMEPFFVLMKLPGQAKEAFYIMSPYTPRNRDNMIGWVAANSDPEKYGERTVYLFPKERVILGPEQISAQINQDALISPQLSLWNQRGSVAIFGNMLVIPIKDSIVYIQPLYLQAEKTAIPELTRVIVVYADRVEMENTLEAALLKVFGQQTAGNSTAVGGVSSDQPGGAVGGAGTGQQLSDVAAAKALYLEAIAAQRKGDWATYGSKVEELGKILSRLAAQESTATPKK